MYEEYSAFERAYIQKHNMKREIFTVRDQELEKILTLCKQHSVTVNNWLIAKMMVEENTSSVTSHKHMPTPTERNACACLLYTYAAGAD